MCEFCHRHGEGRDGISGAHYSEDLLMTCDGAVHSGFCPGPEHLNEGVRRIERLKRLPPFVRRVVTRLSSTGKESPLWTSRADGGD